MFCQLKYFASENSVVKLKKKLQTWNLLSSTFVLLVILVKGLAKSQAVVLKKFQLYVASLKS